MRKILIILILSFGLQHFSAAQSAIVKDFTPVCDSLSILIKERTTVEGKLKLKAVMKRGNSLDFYFTESLSDYPWHKGDPEWFRKSLKSLFPDKYMKYRLGNIYGKKIAIDRFVTPMLSFDGTASDTKHKTKAPGHSGFVTELDGMDFSKGLEGRNIALWHSHGRYYNMTSQRWEWQRPCLFQTCEDMFTQSFVIPFLVPMLENAGAYVMLPRERDYRKEEVIADNDPTCGIRGSASYAETGKWSDGGQGFADTSAFYAGTQNPFTMGTARIASTVKSDSPTATARWTPEIPARGEYAVYVSYKSLHNSCSAARYKVIHMGGVTEFHVNQKMGGGTWVYLGTFTFDEGNAGYVELDNSTPQGNIQQVAEVITADAVKFGGGMGCIERNGETSGLPRFAEGARYWLQWAGTDSTIFSQNEGKNDYKDDFMSRGDWVEWISRGSRMNPKAEGGLGIPVDLALGFHSDAGVTPNDSLVGTLAIYTLNSDGKETLPGGESRMTNREYADLVQSQIVHDLRAQFDTSWSRRQIWDRGYRESRTPSCPSMLLELLSHQNFADMKYGLDPKFRFAVSRAVYKGMLKYLSNRYGCPYAVQPLPVNSMGVRFGTEGKAVISWRATEDTLEPTAAPEGYILHTRVDDGSFDSGKIIENISRSGDFFTTEVDIVPGRIFSYRIVAYNAGGKSFESETVSIGMPEDKKNASRKILVVNHFTRTGTPAVVDTPEYAGFDNMTDSGVPYIRDLAFIGSQYERRRGMEYISNEMPGFGGCYTDFAAQPVAGNTFDYIMVHGKAFMQAGYPFYSCSSRTFASEDTFSSDAWAGDIICGKEIEVFPEPIRNAMTGFTSEGRHMLVSGACIGMADKNFAQKILGYKTVSLHPCGRPEIRTAINMKILMKPGRTFTFRNRPDPEIYSVENPSGIAPSAASGSTIFRYSDSGTGAGICHDGKGYRTVCLGFPIEVLETHEQIQYIISTTLDFFER